MKTIQVQAPASSPLCRILAAKVSGHWEFQPQARRSISLHWETGWWESRQRAGLEMTLLGGAFLFPDGGIWLSAALTLVRRWIYSRRALHVVHRAPRPDASPWAHAFGSASYCATRRNRRKTFSRQRLDAYTERPRRLRRQSAAQGDVAHHRRRFSASPQANGTRYLVRDFRRAKILRLHSRPQARFSDLAAPVYNTRTRSPRNPVAWAALEGPSIPYFRGT